MIFEVDHKKKLIKNLIIKIIFSTLFIFSNETIAEEKKKKDCLYCNDYERMEDWPVSQRPKEFIYEEIDYPEGMFKSKIDRKTSKNRKSYAGKKVYERFVKKKLG